MTKLDIHRLHKCITKLHEGTPFERREGQTTARLHLMQGEIELGDLSNRYLFVAENTVCRVLAVRQFIEMISQCAPDFENVMKQKDEWTPDCIVMHNGQVYEFINARVFIQTPEMLYGRQYAKVFFDVSTDLQWELDIEGKLSSEMARLSDAGTEFV